MGWNTSARTIKGVTYRNGTPFKLNGNIPYYRNCDSKAVEGYKNNATAYYYGHYSADYSKHPYGVAFKSSRQGNVDYFVDEAAFPPATYYVHYSLNGGSGTFSTQSKPYGGSVATHRHSPTKAGYTFLGWSTSSTATTKSYDPGWVYSGNATITLYAVWRANTYTVTYDANQGEGAPDAQSFVFGSTDALSSKLPTREGHTFINWKFDDTHYFEPGDSIPSGWGNFTLVAQWQVISYNVIINANGGIFSTGETQQRTKEEYGTLLVLPTVSRTGYTFAGWTLTGKGVLRNNNGVHEFTVGNSHITLEAQWAINEHAITFDANTNGGHPSKIVDYKYGDVATDNTEALYTPTKPYCEFVGWCTAADGSGEPVDLNSLVVYRNTVLYALFEEKNTVYVSAEGANRQAMLALHTKDKFVEKCEVMVYADGAWKKAVVQT